MTRNTRSKAQHLAATQSAITKREEMKSTDEVEGVVVGLAAVGAPDQFHEEIKGVEGSPIHPDAVAATNLKNPHESKDKQVETPACRTSNKRLREKLRLDRLAAEKAAIQHGNQPGMTVKTINLSSKDVMEDGSSSALSSVHPRADETAGTFSSPEKLHGLQTSLIQQTVAPQQPYAVSKQVINSQQISQQGCQGESTMVTSILNSESAGTVQHSLLSSQQAPVAPVNIQQVLQDKLNALAAISNAGTVSFQQQPVSLVASKQVNSDSIATQPVVNMQGGGHLTVSSRIPVVNMPVNDSLTDCSRLSASKTQQDDHIVDKNFVNGGSCDVDKSSQNVDKTTVPSKSPWLEAVKNNRKVEFMGKLKENLDGFDGIGITLTEADVYPEEDEEAKCLIGMFNGRFPGKDMVQRMVDYWPKACTFHYHNSGWIVFKFEEVCDLEEVLSSASFYAGKHIMVVKKMPREFDFSKDEYSLVPLWVQFPNLPLCAWKEESLNKICSFIGKPLNVDKLTKDRETISFARCLIECDVSMELPGAMYLTMPSGKKRFQKILYEEKPSFCNRCKKIGHVEGNCHAISIPGETVYISRSRLEATKNKNMPRGRSKKRNKSRGPSKPPTTTVAPNASAYVPNNDKNGTTDSIVSSINTDDVTLGKASAGKIVPVSNAFGAIGSWAADSELEEENQGNKVQGENGKAMVVANHKSVPASNVNDKKGNANQKGNETQKGNVGKTGPAASMKGNGRGIPSSLKPK